MSINVTTEKNIYCFDVEVFQNFFSFTAVNPNDQQDQKVFVVFSDPEAGRDDRGELLEFIRSEDLVLCGYNSLGYDNIIVNFILKYGHKQSSEAFCKSLYKLSQAIIGERDYGRNEKVSELRKMPVGYRSLDLMKIKASDMQNISLKQLSINLKWHRVEDLPVHYTSFVTAELVNQILDYNLNDVLITVKFFWEVREQIILRQDVSADYGVDVINQTESGIANQILNVLYGKATKQEYWDFSKGRSDRKLVKIKDCIYHKIKFNSSTLQTLLEELKGLTVFAYADFKFKRNVNFAGNIFELGVGGLHSKDTCGVFKSDKNQEVIDADVTSYYPNIMLNQRIKPDHLSEDFLTILKQITVDRVAAKKAGQKTKEKALKITINSIFGKLGSEFFWLYDPKAMIQVTLNGQLYLLMLVERLHLAGIQVISANTDGIVSIVKKKQKVLYQTACKEWEEETDFNLEFTKYLSYFRRDVNNYITQKEGNTKDSIKAKGCFESEINLFKGYKYPIVATAIKKYFLEGVSIEDTIFGCEDIYEFMMSQKTGKEFVSVYNFVDESGVFRSEKLQKNNRFYVTQRGGSLGKQKQQKKISILAGEQVRIINNVYPETSFNSYFVDHQFYIEEAYKIIDQIEPRRIQLSLFAS